MPIARHALRQLLVFALLFLANRAYAYDAPGHFYTVTYALQELDAPTPSWDRDRNVIAFCSWLADESVELSATSVLTAAASSYSMASGADIDVSLTFKMILAHPLGAYGISGCSFYSDPRPDRFRPEHHATGSHRPAVHSWAYRWRSGDDHVGSARPCVKAVGSGETRTRRTEAHRLIVRNWLRNAPAWRFLRASTSLRHGA